MPASKAFLAVCHRQSKQSHAARAPPPRTGGNDRVCFFQRRLHAHHHRLLPIIPTAGGQAGEGRSTANAEIVGQSVAGGGTPASLHARAWGLQAARSPFLHLGSRRLTQPRGEPGPCPPVGLCREVCRPPSAFRAVMVRSSATQDRQPSAHRWQKPRMALALYSMSQVISMRRSRYMSAARGGRAR